VPTETTTISLVPGSPFLRVRQSNREFSTFFAEFQRLAEESETYPDLLATILQDSLSSEMRTMLLFDPAPSGCDYVTFCNHLQDLDNRQRQFTTVSTASRGLRIPFKPLNARETPLVPRTAKPLITDTLRLADGEPMDLDNVKGRKISEPGVREFCSTNSLCFYCKNPGHSAVKCPNKSTQALNTTRARTGRISPSPSDGDYQSIAGGVEVSKN